MQVMDVDDDNHDDNDDDEILVALEHESRVDEPKKGWKDGRRGWPAEKYSLRVFILE